MKQFDLHNSASSPLLGWWFVTTLKLLMPYSGNQKGQEVNRDSRSTVWPGETLLTPWEKNPILTSIFFWKWVGEKPPTRLITSNPPTLGCFFLQQQTTKKLRISHAHYDHLDEATVRRFHVCGGFFRGSQQIHLRAVVWRCGGGQVWWDRKMMKDVSEKKSLKTYGLAKSSFSEMYMYMIYVYVFNTSYKSWNEIW